MKTLKIIFYSIIFSFSSLLIVETANAQSAITVNPMKLVNIPSSLQGQYLTVYFGIGARAAISTNSNQVTLKKIRKKIDNIQITSASAHVPGVDIPRTGFYQPYNLIVFVIHSQPNFNWQNIETDDEGNIIRTIPEGEIPGQNIQATASISLTKVEFEDLIVSQGVPNIVQIDLQNRIHFLLDQF
ncbi:MAG: hypothetical protein BroJett040_02730 [Oligoflexia bacterium]|nr:MAG: hypothetical protein BroJett040_02730 [Oligoflexia bacterium]